MRTCAEIKLVKEYAPSDYRQVGAALVKRQMARQRLSYSAMGLKHVSRDTLRRFLTTERNVEPSTVWAIEEALGLPQDLLYRTLAGETTLIHAMLGHDTDLRDWIVGQLMLAGAEAPKTEPGAWRTASG